MDRDGALRNEQPIGDFTIRPAFSQNQQDTVFPRTEAKTATAGGCTTENRSARLAAICS